MTSGRGERAIVFCEGNFNNANGKTAHGLVRHSSRFEVVGVVDSAAYPGDAGELLDGRQSGIPMFSSLKDGIKETSPSVFVVGAVSEGGGLPGGYRDAVAEALEAGLGVVSGLHEFLSDDPELVTLAEGKGVGITDVRKLFRDHRRFYTGEIGEVGSTRVALIGTDSAIGKRTTAVQLVRELRARGRKADMIYTGQTGWMQGWPHGVVMDALINDFVSGGIEGAILASWRDDAPEFMLIEGQGSLVHPFFPGGFEIMAAGQIHGFILQDAPGRPCLDGFPGYPMPDPGRVVEIARLICERPLIGIAINPEGLDKGGLQDAKAGLGERFAVPVEEPMSEGVRALADAVEGLRDGR